MNDRYLLHSRVCDFVMLVENNAPCSNTLKSILVLVDKLGPQATPLLRLMQQYPYPLDQIFKTSLSLLEDTR